MNKLTIVIEEDRGVFLGNYENIAIFSKNDFLESTRAYGFSNTKEAREFIEKSLPQIKDTVEYVEIPTDAFGYVDVIDMIKAGYADRAEEMFMNMPTAPTVH